MRRFGVVADDLWTPSKRRSEPTFRGSLVISAGKEGQQERERAYTDIEELHDGGPDGGLKINNRKE